MNGNSKSVIITVSVIACIITMIIYYYFKYRQIEIIEHRKFDVFNDMEYKILKDELENPYLLWDTDGKRKLEFQPFSEWKLTIQNHVPKRLEIDSLIYFPKSFNAIYPMYYENKDLDICQFPSKNSMIIATEPMEWISGGDEEMIGESFEKSKQTVIVGEKIKIK